MPCSLVEVSGDMTLTRSMPESSMRLESSSVMRSPASTMVFVGLRGSKTSSAENRPTMRSARETSMVSPSKIARFQMPSRVPQSSSVMTASMATSQSLRVM
jgi:hypothetical protein